MMRGIGVICDPPPKNSIWARLFVADDLRIIHFKNVGVHLALDERFARNEWHENHGRPVHEKHVFFFYHARAVLRAARNYLPVNIVRPGANNQVPKTASDMASFAMKSSVQLARVLDNNTTAGRASLPWMR